MSRRRARGTEPVTGADLREAERGFISMLRSKGFPGAWIDRNAIDLLAQAASEYAAWLKSHEAEGSPVGWLITCAYRRAINLLESQNRRAPTSSIEDAFDLADEKVPTPEEETLDNERQRALREAIDCLESKERRLISLVYFEGRSVRDAGRRLGWRKSAADRHHRAALDRLRAIVGDDRSLLSAASLGLAAQAARGEGRSGFAGRLAEGLRRLLPFAEPGGAAASGGLGRAAGVCGAGLAAALCGLVVTGVRPALPGSGAPSPSRPAQVHVAPEPAAAAKTVLAVPPLSTSKRGEGSRAPGQRHTTTVQAKVSKPKPTPADSRPPTPVSAHAPEPVVEEFGIEGGLPEEAPVEEESTTASTPTPQSPSAAPPQRARQASGAQVSEEFGLQ